MHRGIGLEFKGSIIALAACTPSIKDIFDTSIDLDNKSKAWAVLIQYANHSNIILNNLTIFESDPNKVRFFTIEFYVRMLVLFMKFLKRASTTDFLIPEYPSYLSKYLEMLEAFKEYLHNEVKKMNIAASEDVIETFLSMVIEFVKEMKIDVKQELDFTEILTNIHILFTAFENNQET